MESSNRREDLETLCEEMKVFFTSGSVNREERGKASRARNNCRGYGARD